MITFEGVSKMYDDGTEAVHSLDLHIKKGEFFVFIGPSGCGKTTSLKMINRLVHLTTGTLYIDGQRISDYEINELRWNIGYVLQQIALFPHMTIAENIAIVPELKKWSSASIQARIDELLHMVDLDPATYRQRKPDELSGGEQQRVGVIRALAADPDIILMDEPFSALDPITRQTLQNDIVDLQQRIQKTIVFVTHDMQEALALGDRIGVMQEGELVQADTPQAIRRQPANDFVQQFVESGVERQEGDISAQHVKVLDLYTPQQPANPGSGQDQAASVYQSLQDVLPRLASEDGMPVQKDGEVVGTLTRQAVISHLAVHMEKGDDNR